MKNFDASPEAAMSFLISQRTYIEPQIYETRYPDVDYPEFIPVDTSAPDWTPIVAVRSVDFRGELEFIGPNSNDVNRADVGYSLGTHRIQTAALGYGYSLEEIQQAMLMGNNLSADKAVASMRAAQQGLNKLAYVGKPTANYHGIFNYPGVPVSTAPDTIANLAAATTNVGGAQALVQFLQGALNKVYVDQTNTTFMPTHIFLPPAQYAILASTILPFGGNMTILNYLQANLLSGRQPVTIVPNINLRGIGAGGTDRMVVYTRSMETAKFHMPMPYQFVDPYRDSGLSWFVPGIVRTGGSEVRIPMAFSYIDGV